MHTLTLEFSNREIAIPKRVERGQRASGREDASLETAAFGLLSLNWGWAQEVIDEFAPRPRRRRRAAATGRT